MFGGILGGFLRVVCFRVVLGVFRYLLRKRLGLPTFVLSVYYVLPGLVYVDCCEVVSVGFGVVS